MLTRKQHHQRHALHRLHSRPIDIRTYRITPVLKADPVMMKTDFPYEEWLMRHYFNEALKEARKAAENDEVPVGCVIVHQNKIIARAHNQVETLSDPTAHAEMIALTQATAALKSKWLYDCTVFVTLEPCAMCGGAFVLARVPYLIFGAYDPKAGACGTVLNVINRKELNHRVVVKGGVEEATCAQLLSAFFKKQRALGKK